MTLNDANPQWTTRFTIASATGAVTAAQYTTQPDGAAIAWGIGKLGKSSASTKASGAATTTDTVAATATDDDLSPTATDSADDATATDSADADATTTDDGDASSGSE